MTNCEIMTIILKTDSDSGQIDLGGPTSKAKWPRMTRQESFRPQESNPGINTMGLLPAISSQSAVVRHVTCRKGRQVSQHHSTTERLLSSGTFCLEDNQQRYKYLLTNQKL